MAKVKNQGFSIKSVPNPMLLSQNLFILGHFSDLRKLIDFLLGFFSYRNNQPNQPIFCVRQDIMMSECGKIFWSENVKKLLTQIS